MPKFIKKPQPIEAVKCTKENEAAIVALLNAGTTDWEVITDDNGTVIGYFIHSWEGVDPVYYDPAKNVNKKHPEGAIYWVMKGLEDECYPCIADSVEDAPLGYCLVEE